MTHAHTPGPWTVTKGFTCYSPVTIRSKSGRLINEFLTWNAQTEANARLMASSPELRRELKKAHRTLCKYGYDMTSIDAVIAKATEDVRDCESLY